MGMCPWRVSGDCTATAVTVLCKVALRSSDQSLVAAGDRRRHLSSISMTAAAGVSGRRPPANICSMDTTKRARVVTKGGSLCRAADRWGL
jgi:hypothetical protein